MASLVRLTVRGVNSLCRSSLRRAQSTFEKEWMEEEAHAAKTMVTWKNISLFVALPAIALVTYSTFQKENAHHKHIEEHGRTEFVPYAHLRMRTKPFPWKDGNHSLFHNPETNPLPEGYET